MKLRTTNEWGRLRTVVVGSAAQANWPTSDPVFNQEKNKTSWTSSPVPSGPVPQWIIDESNEDLETLSETLKEFSIEVLRPTPIDFQSIDGMYNYCPRDRLVISGSTIVDPAMMYPCRDQEIQALDFVCAAADKVIQMPRDQGMVLDAANICRLNDAWLYLISPSGNQIALEWLQQQLPNIDVVPCNFYSGVHIDSTIVPIREGLVALNASRVSKDNCPRVFDSWDKIWVEDMTEQSFYEYPWASKWIGMNMLSIDPMTVVVEKSQHNLISQLESHGITPVPLTLRHSRTLGGGFHCATLDLVRDE